MGLLREMNYLADSPQWVLAKPWTLWCFWKSSPPHHTAKRRKKITLCYFGISQSMTQLNDYFRCDAYATVAKLFNANDTELLKGHNVYTVLSRMSYLHGRQRSGLTAQVPVIPTPCWTAPSISTP